MNFSSIAYEVWSVLAPIVATFLSVVILPLATAGLYKWLSKLGLDIDQKNRDAFQTSLNNAALLVVSKMGGAAATSIVTKEALEQGISFVQNSVPDAIKHFDIKPEDIAARLKPKAEAIVQSVPTIIPEVEEIAISSPLLKKVQRT